MTSDAAPPTRRRTRSATAQRVVLHVALWVGAAVFALPFVWLVATSVKWDREVFAESQSWLARLVPRLPYRVDRTPYIAVAETPDFVRPGSLSRRDWDALRDRLEPVLWDAVQPAIAKQEVPDPLRNDIRRTMTRDLWRRVIGEVPEELWRQPTSRIVTEVAARVTPEKVAAAWSSVYRSVRIGAPTIQALDQSDYALERMDWHVARGELRAVAPGIDVNAGTELWTNYQRTLQRSVVGLFYADAKLPIDPAKVRAITIPVHGDESYHHFTASVEVSGATYQSSEPIVLRNYTWQEVTLQVRGNPLPHERENIQLSPATSSAGASLSGNLRVTLTLHRTPYWQAIWRKFARNYEDASTFVRFWLFVRNTVQITALSIVAQLLSCSLAAFGFARLRWPLREPTFLVLLSTMMLPPQVTMIPVFLIMRRLGLYDTLHPLWIGSLFGSAFFIFLLRQFLLGVPRDLEDAAKIDGCSYFGIYWRIMLPLVKPALAAIAIFQFMGAWNDFLGPLIYVSSERNTTLSLGLQMFQSLHTNEYGMLMAAATVMAIPVIVVFFVAQRYFIQGVTLTGMKG
ncbi:ABC transporter permease subunit [Candidatus Poribacteria bacterium]|nr:ABC transporter permease subunit [Candidatus Poribacteria bacterium]